MSRDEMSALQGKRLNKLVNLVYHNVPFYRNKMQEMDLSPDDIQTIEDIVKLPFTTKQDLRDNYPYGLQAAPASEIVRVHASSGTTGNPTIVGYTRRDLSVWSEVMSRCLFSIRGLPVMIPFLSVMAMACLQAGGRTLWGGESGGDCYPGFYRKYGKACPSDSRLGYNGNCLYSFIRSLSGQEVGGTYGIDQE